MPTVTAIRPLKRASKPTSPASAAIPAEEANAARAAAPPKQPPFLDDGFPNPLAAEDIFDYMENHLDEEHWNQVTGYLYRVDPPQMRIEGKDAYMLKFSRPISREEIAKRFGGKVFKVHLNRRRPGKRQNETLRAEPVAIEAVPILANGEQWAPQPLAGGSMPASGDRNLLEHFVMDTIKQRDEALRSGKSFDSSAHIQAAIASGQQIQQQGFTAALAALKDSLTRPPADDGSGGLMKLMMAKMVERMFEPQPDPVDQIEKYTRLKELFGGGSSTPAGASENVQIVGAIMQALPSVIEPLKEIAVSVRDSILAQNGMSPNTSANNGTRPAVQPQQSATLQPQAIFTPADTTPADQTSTTSATQPTATAAAPGVDPIAQHANQMLVDMLLNDETGDVAALAFYHVHPAYAEAFYAEMTKNPSLFAKVPQFKPILQDPRLPAFVKAFLNWFAQPDQAATTDAAGGSNGKRKTRAAA